MKTVDPNLPIDKTAALVVSKSSHHGFDFKCGSKITSMTPLPTRQFPGLKEHDLTGKIFGDFIVIGCAVWIPNNGGRNSVRWVSKCRCGRYQMFTSKAVKSQALRVNDGIEFRIACVECEKKRNIGRKNWAVIDILNAK